MKPATLLAILALAWAAPALAQTSANYKLQEHNFNAGGDPSQGGVLTAPHYKITFDSIGDPLARTDMNSPGFHVDSGFVARYRPPAEITGVKFVNKTTLQWNPDRSIGEYEVYRAATTTLPGAFGQCFSMHLTSETASDASNPTVGVARFYLVTARNRLGEESSKGYRSSGVERTNSSPCP
ncbi:MAG TPA: hypothetical protein VJS92_14530 [Candidatus Polarisedimenticolaceae bacterium]|nr:hypothetical protein [Candidatus Polarisedimenticolaceae bacterium]